MSPISSEQAVALAESFISDKRAKYQCGDFLSVKHVPGKAKAHEAGTFYVEFAYKGLPVGQRTTPPRDHPTVVLVNDENGDCRVMFWM
jgi:hypothetical protein